MPDASRPCNMHPDLVALKFPLPHLKEALKRKRKIKIGRTDLRIAATVLEHGAILVTRNRRDFKQVPGLRIDRSGIALVGAAAMLGAGVLSLPDAARSVDYETLILLFGMIDFGIVGRLSLTMGSSSQEMAGYYAD